MRCELSDICVYRNERISTNALNSHTYVSTENMLPDKGGITDAASLPTVSQTSKFRYGDTLVSNIRPYFKKIWFAEYDGGCSNDVLVFSAKEGVDPKYLYYVLANDSFFAYSTATSKGTKMPRGDKTSIMQYQIEKVDSPTQKKIAAIFSALDEKIAINRAINENLERQAQALYLEWFISHLGEHAEQYRKVSLADLMDYAGGSQPPASEFISEQRDGYVRLVQIRDYESNSHITYIPVSGKNKLCEEHDIMIARYGAALGRICFGLNGAYNVALAKVFPKQKYYREFLRCYLSSREFYEGINNKGGRSAQAGFNQSDIRSFEVFIPVDESTIQSFESLATPIFEKRLHIIKENQSLVTLRDTLLPKLMSGEIDVSAI